MKKIMFNDRYGLTDAVLAGSKTMTRIGVEYVYRARCKDIPARCDGKKSIQ